MQNIVIAVLVFLIVDMSESASKESYLDHERRLPMFPCSVPQPRVFELNEVISEDLILEKADGEINNINPHITILHRCGATGCCDKGKTCVPIESDDVVLTFAVFGRSAQYFQVKEVNHTQCICAS